MKIGVLGGWCLLGIPCIVAVICEGDRVCVEYDFAATSPGSVPGWPGAGEHSVSHLCAVYTVRDGLIVAARDYRDRVMA